MKPRWVLAVMLLVGLVGVALGGGGWGQRRDATEDPVTDGAVATDFSLSRFTDVDPDDPAASAAAERVQLSSFRGKRAVCLMFSSYT